MARRRYKKKSNTKIYMLLLAIILVGLAILAVNYFEDKLTDNSSSSQNDTDKEPENTATPEPADEPTATPTDEPTQEPTAEPTEEPTPTPVPFVMTWNLILVNENNPLPDDFDVKLKTYGEKDVDERIHESLSKMLSDAKNAGMSLWVASGYRSVSYQEGLLERATNNRMKDYGMTKEEARENALLTIALPGSSEHHTGLAVDFNYVKQDFKDTKEYTWLLENCANYGFILRYPSDKEDITMINYEPWHYRYVGVEAAKEMKELGMCLEEYIEYLGG